jgi:hypothetical protein
MGAPNQQRPDLEQIIRERQDAARQAMYASGSDPEQPAATDFAGMAKRATLLLFGGTALCLLIVIATTLIGHIVMFGMASLGVTSPDSDISVAFVCTLFFFGSLAVCVILAISAESQISCWLKTGRAS